MAETQLARLKRLAAEKRAAEGAAVVSVAPVVVEEKVNDALNTGNPVASVDNSTSDTGSLVSDNKQVAPLESVDNNTALVNSNSFTDSPVARTVSSHPLAMQFAELEQGLLQKDPLFKTILRDIHRQLGTEPELVTQMSEEEVALVVRGLVEVAQNEIVEPSKVKAAKAAVKAAGKKVITADDL